ncbi:chemotaxis protein CheB [Limisalsivibrio acetivorans]|uniref:chemotaxis protein CheB n=1 Tax=Limisalsivibrio acetivorans TaxID=1304888 RepID=UPI0003B4EF18|nr:chemotaxis protein CheB [Limisalsivibrio acetivorans]
MKDTENAQMPDYYVAIGASAGGLEAIENFFKHMPHETNISFIVIQHLSPDHKSLMVELLSKHTKMDVHRAEDGLPAEAGKVYLIPPKKNLTIFHGKLILKDHEPNRAGINLPIDIFMNSLAEDQGDKAVGIILSGTGSDGMRGIRSIKEAGGMVMVQTEDSAKFDGMPKSAISTGLSDFILPPEDMPETLLSFIKHPNITKQEVTSSNEEDMTRIFALLRERTKVDFTYYKPSTVVRRIDRRIAVNQLMNTHDYVRYMERSPAEVNALYRELLIGVTNFFRDKEAFDTLKTYVEKIIHEKDENEEIRVWVAGCSTGEEAYSIAILFLESLEQMGIKRKLKIFATDVDNNAVTYAGNGVYSESIAADLSPHTLAKYFSRKDDTFVINRNVRELVVFAQHNLIKDPPFTKMDLISCRNLLIYLQPLLQNKVLEMFSFALNTGSYLFLGTSETTGDLSDCFETVHPKWKIYLAKYRRKATLEERNESAYKNGSSYSLRMSSPRLDIGSQALKYYESEKLYERLLETIAGDYMSLVLVTNEQNEIMHTIGETARFLHFPPGRMTNDITKIIRKELAIPLATGLQKAIKSRDEVRYSNLQLQDGGTVAEYRMRIKFLPLKKGREPLLAIFIDEISKQERGESSQKIMDFDVGAEAEQRINDLEQELQLTKENLQATIEELETSNEELQATNEELLASNEELQSTNEELQSVNEELYTVNSEYQNKITELTELNNDMDNLLSSTEIGTLFLDEDMNIRKFTPLLTNIFRIIDNDIGRSLEDITHNIKNCDIYALVKQCCSVGDVVEQEVNTTDGKWYLMRIIPYNVAPNTYAGLTLTFIGIDKLKIFQKQLEENQQRFLETEKAAGVGTWELMLNGGELRWSNVEPIFSMEPGSFNNTYEGFIELVHPDDRDSLEASVDKCLKDRGKYDMEHRIITPDGEIRWMHETGSVITDEQGEPVKMLGVVRDITEQVETHTELANSIATTKSILEAATIGVGMVRNREFIFINKKLREFTGYEDEELVGHSAEMLYPDHEEFERVGEEKYGEIEQKGIGRVFTKWKNKSGKLINILLTSVPLNPDNLEEGVVFTAMDLSGISEICSSMNPGNECMMKKKNKKSKDTP